MQTPADYPPPAPATIAGPPIPPSGTSTLTEDAPPPQTPATAPPAADTPGRPGAVAAMTAIGVGLLATAVVISASRSRADGDLDWSNYLVGLGATAALVLVAVVAAGVVRRRDNPLGRGQLVTWPGVVGILGVAAMFVVGLEDQGWLEDILGYVVGGIIAGLAAIGFLASRRAAFAVLVIYGLGLMYTEAYGDFFSDIGDSDDFAIITGIALTVFVVGATVVGWLLPTRAITGVAVGVAGVVGLVTIMTVLMVTQLFSGAFSPLGMFGMGDDPVDPSAEQPDPPDFTTDAWVLLALAALLVVLWAFAAAWTGHSGFTILAIVLPAAVVPMGMVVLTVEHPTWWGVAVAVAGSVLLAGGGLLGRRRARSARIASSY